MPELRLNVIAREWVLFAKEKNVEPEDFVGVRELKDSPEFFSVCPFCPGNEALTPDEIFRTGDEHNWKIRVVKNRFSKLSEEGQLERWNNDLKIGANGVGIHEVIVDTPYHNHTIATMPLSDLEDVLGMYKTRLTDIYKDPKVEHAIIFKNSGHAAGTEIEHSISQIVGIPVTPVRLKDRIETYDEFFKDTGSCLMCRTLTDELSDGRRVLLETEHFVSFVPYAALSPFHIWIFPKRHSHSFSDMLPGEIIDLASNLRITMSKLYYGLYRPDFNYVINSVKPGLAGAEFTHWYISIVPRVTYVSGFEIGSGIYINPMLPEMSAGYLRDVKIPE